MLGHKDRNFKQHIAISVEDLVPPDNFYKRKLAVLFCLYPELVLTSLVFSPAPTFSTA
jgi:hypothetical protein